MNKKQILSFLLATTLTATVAAVPAVALAKANETAKQTYVPTVTSKENDTMIDLLSGDILKFAQNYSKGLSDKYVKSGEGIVAEDKYFPTPVTLNWQAEEGALYYTLKLSTKPDLSNAKKYVTFVNSHVLEDLFMGTKYYYQVVAQFENKTVKSQIFTFETSYLPRTIFVEGVSNTRDAGGYYTTDGTHRIRQGLVYRGGKMEDITQAGKDKMLNFYGIKTDLDLRAEKTVSPLGDSVNFINVSGPYYAGGGTAGVGIDSLKDSSKGPWVGTYRDALIKEIKTFANPDNYPIYVHCSLGRDRTGTIIFLINALCGVGDKDLYLDYETSMFSVLGVADHQTGTNMANTFTSLFNYLKLTYKQKTMAENVEKFMLDIGITQAEIDSIRNVLLEEV